MVAERVRKPVPDDPSWLRMLLAIRTQRNWTQARLARELGVSISTIAGWENGRQEPRPVWVRVLSVLLREGQ